MPRSVDFDDSPAARGRLARLAPRGPFRYLRRIMTDTAQGYELNRSTCLALLGSLGISHDHLLEKWFRDCRITDIYEGTGEIQRLIIARYLLRYSPKELN